MKINVRSACVLLVMMPLADLYAQETIDWSGRRIMEEVYDRHQQFPYVYEEQSMVLVDNIGRRDTRKLRRYSRVEADGTVKFLLIFDSPVEVKGVALLAIRAPDGETEMYIYLPAYGQQLIESTGKTASGNFLGSDFSIENLTGEVLSMYRYVRGHDVAIEGIKYYVVDVYRRADKTAPAQPLRRHFVQQENFYITRTDHFDKQGRLHKRQTHHDLRPVDGDMWRSNMILMEDKREQHQSLIKIDRRVFSHDYVPEEMFHAEWLYKHYPAPVQPEVINEEIDNAAEAAEEAIQISETDKSKEASAP